MQSSSRRPGRRKANALDLHEDRSVEQSRGYYASSDGTRVVEIVHPTHSKRRKVNPQDIDAVYGDWIPANDVVDAEEGEGGVPPVMPDPHAAGKRARYEESSVSVSCLGRLSPIANVDFTGVPHGQLAPSHAGILERNDETRKLSEQLQSSRADLPRLWC